MSNKQIDGEVFRYYGDIIDLPHPVSKRRAHMSQVDRAAQFSPFAALTGHGAAIQETARLTESDAELAEDTREMLDLRLAYLKQQEQPEVTVTYFLPDEKKEGGAFVDYTGKVKRIDSYRRMILFLDETSIPIDKIVALKGEIFSSFDG